MRTKYFDIFQDVKCVIFFVDLLTICVQKSNKKLFEFIGIHTLKDFVSQLIHQDNVNLKTSTKKTITQKEKNNRSEFHTKK